MLLLRLTRRLLGAAPRSGRWPGAGAAASPALPASAGCLGPAPAPALGLLGRPARGLLCRASPPCARPELSLPGRGARRPLEEPPVPRSPSLSALEARLGALLPAAAARPAPRCPTAAPRLQCRNVLKIRRRKMNHHKYRKLVRRTRFLRRRVREGRLQRKQAKFEGDLRRIWLKAGLKDPPAGWQTPRIYLKGK